MYFIVIHNMKERKEIIKITFLTNFNGLALCQLDIHDLILGGGGVLRGEGGVRGRGRGWLGDEKGIFF